ncbi:hypothetical protein H6G00_22240 [Leptolyngbya sp. FACHB-541]|uniref:hypothetical protein n=1 Tax=Leptolyngbya sp. FACHB-541 TaxID=2692810 RepID=UPI001687D165|nr:hypothetical protein [Leptolyngbya sp. FACHB-541]MBD1999297.1 hypothetical protein [Leptolyngbya sp. FACHB-541]
MTLSASIIRAIDRLLTDGEVSRSGLASLPTGYQLGLWADSTDATRAVATPEAVRLLRTLPTRNEAIAAVLGCEPDIRQAWQRIATARLKEMGNLRDAQGLSEAITTLGQTCLALLPNFSQASLSPTPYADLERAVFDASAEQAIATPQLLRALGATAHLIEGEQGKPTITIPDLALYNPLTNWCKGRLIKPPERVATLPETGMQHTSILPGSWAIASPPDSPPPHRSISPTMYWVLSCPWLFLLAQVVFTQEAWGAERIAGRLSLELESTHLSQYYRPPEVLVVVTTTEDEEVVCGTLSQLLLRVLDLLGVTLLAPDVTAIESQLPTLIESLLKHQIWRFDQGSGGRRPGYSIHDSFSDGCYYLAGKYFNRLGTHVTAAIRITCGQWAKERLAQTGKLAALIS